MEQLFGPTLIGIIATATMTSFLWLLTGLQIADVDMVRAIGSLVTRSLEKAFLPGLLLHFIVGIIMAHLYIYLLRIPGILSTEGFVGLGAFIGLMHGIVVSIALVVLVAEHHPLARYQKAGISVALYHVIAHVVYGLMVGLLAGLWIFNVNHSTENKQTVIAKPTSTLAATFPYNKGGNASRCLGQGMLSEKCGDGHQYEHELIGIDSNTSSSRFRKYSPAG